MPEQRPIRDETEDELLQSGLLSGHVTTSSPPRVSHSRQLLDVARRLMDQGDYAIAVVVAHTACEVAVEVVMSQAMQARRIADLEDAIEGLLNGYALTNDRARSLYTALTGDNIQQNKALWNPYCESTGRRNRVVHRGATVDEAEAEGSLQVATQFVAHLKQL